MSVCLSDLTGMVTWRTMLSTSDMKPMSNILRKKQRKTEACLPNFGHSTLHASTFYLPKYLDIVHYKHKI
jgi:hypothetical protein